MHAVADQASGQFDAVIHNAGVYLSPKRIVTVDGLQQTFAVNVLAPYLLTARMEGPKRLVYMSSGMHRAGDPDLSDPQWERRSWSASQAYSDSKLYDVMLAFAVARLWPETISTAVDPGWVPTKMGGPGAPDDLDLGSLTQAWLAVSDDKAALVTGTYFHHQKAQQTHPAASDTARQQELLSYCASLCGVKLAESMRR
jgi:NAD(P)-dependent dehydrogenase (short-subunit alcohol dehydrogenase family)